MLLVGWAVDLLLGFGLAGVAVAVVVAGVGSAVAYWKSDSIALAMSHARPADPTTYARLHNLVEGLCIAAGLPKPELYVVEDAAPNAFATGRNPAHAALVVTRGLLDKLSRVELEGVLAHELSHIRNGDILVTTLAVTLLGLLPVPALSSQLIGLTVSRRRESEADLSGVRLTRYPPGLIAALEKVRIGGPAVRSASRATAHLWLESPHDHRDSIDERISALRDL